MTNKWLNLFDIGTFLLISLAGFIIWYGSYVSYHAPSASRKDPQSKGYMPLWSIILMPVIGSVVLVLLFYFLGKLYYVLIVYISIISVLYATFIISLWIAPILKDKNKSFQVKWVGAVSYSDLAALVLSVTLVIIWNVVPGSTPVSVILTDILAFFIAVSSLSFVRLPNMMITTVLLSLFFVYDIFWVFFSASIFKESVMISVATNMPSLPLLIIVPKFFVEGEALLGLGDIVLPGIFLCYLYHVDKFKMYTVREGYFPRALGLYIIGLVLAYVIVVATEMGQPALLYLVPITLIPTAIFAWRRGELKELWRGRVNILPDLESGTYNVVDQEEMR